MRERGGRIVVRPISSNNRELVESDILFAIEKGATIYTDEFTGYKSLHRWYNHDSINHNKGEYVRENVTTNSIESVWAIVKRAYKGIHHQWSPKHGDRYYNEIAYRLTEGRIEKQLNRKPHSPPFRRRDMTDTARDKEDVYGPGFIKAKRHAMARSGGKCQFCGLRKASEGHHWAWPDYPTDEEVQGHDITALCEVCHELATLFRDWIGRKHVNFDQIAEEFESAKNFYQRRKAFSYWLFPDEEEENLIDARTQTKHEHVPVREGVSLDVLRKGRRAIERQMEHLEQGRSADSSQGLENAKAISRWTNLPLNANLFDLQSEYKALGRQARQRKRNKRRRRKSA